MDNIQPPKRFKGIHSPYKRHILLVGNPGVGKSTILNGLINKLKFKNGFNIGKGVTQVLQFFEHTDGISYGDTPGLSDLKLRNIAAQEITKALQRDGEYKIFFVVTLEAGRVKPDDVTTINLVLNSIETQVQYAIIINKASKTFIEKVKENKDSWNTLFGGLNSGIHKTNFIYYFQKSDELDDQDDKVPDLPKELTTFIYDTVPYTLISKEKVQNIQLDNFEGMKELLSKQIQEMKEKAEIREKHLEETIKRIESNNQRILEENQKRIDDQQSKIEELEEERKKNQRVIDQKQKELHEKEKLRLQERNNQILKEKEELQKKVQYLEDTKAKEPVEEGGCTIF